MLIGLGQYKSMHLCLYWGFCLLPWGHLSELLMLTKYKYIYIYIFNTYNTESECDGKIYQEQAN